MLTGPELGAAIEAAVVKKGITKKKLAEDFGVKPPSVQGWIKNGRIDKAKLFDLMQYFSDVVDSSHWGISPSVAVMLYSAERERAGIPLNDQEAALRNAVVHGIPSGSAGAVGKVLEMLRKHKSLSATARDQIAQAVEQTVAEAVQSCNVISADFSGSRLKPGELLIPQYDVRGSMGHGQVPADYTDFMRNVVVSAPQLEKLGLDYTSPANLAIISGWGQSMAPTIQDKDPVIVDRGVTDFIGDGVYVITWDDMLYIKRLQSAGDGKLELISDNPKHKDRVVNTDEVAIHARVLLVWNAQKL